MKFKIGDCVDVTPNHDDLFGEFTGVVVGYYGSFTTVRNQDGNEVDCSEDQLRLVTDTSVRNADYNI